MINKERAPLPTFIVEIASYRKIFTNTMMDLVYVVGTILDEVVNSLFIFYSLLWIIRFKTISSVHPSRITDRTGQ